MEEQKKRPWVRILTNESFIGCACLTILGCVAAGFGYKEALLVAAGGIAGMLKNMPGQE
jgi:hypothetical protein